MRSLLLLAAVASLSAVDLVANDLRAVNTICPVTGRKIDGALKPVAARSADGRTIQVGVSDADCAAIISRDQPRYAALAEANRAEKPKP